MPEANARGHQVPTAAEAPSRAGWVLNPLLSVDSIVPVADRTAALAAATALSPTTAKPLWVHQADTGIVYKTTDAATFVPITPGGLIVDGVSYAQPRTDGLLSQLVVTTAPYRRAVHVTSHLTALNNVSTEEYDAELQLDASIVRSERMVGKFITVNQSVTKYVAAGVSATFVSKIVRVLGGNANYQHSQGSGFNPSRLELTALVVPAPL